MLLNIEIPPRVDERLKHGILIEQHKRLRPKASVRAIVTNVMIIFQTVYTTTAEMWRGGVYVLVLCMYMNPRSS